jgi:hypothetical protein
VPTGAVAFVSALLGSTMQAVDWPSMNGRSGLDSVLLTPTVYSSSTTVPISLKKRLSLFVLLAPPARSNENLTVAALKGCPFSKRTPRRSLKTKVFMSGDDDQLSASIGVTEPSALTLVSVSKMLYCAISAMADAAPVVGSRPGGSSGMPMLSMFLPVCACASGRKAPGIAAAMAVPMRVRRFNIRLSPGSEVSDPARFKPRASA